MQQAHSAASVATPSGRALQACLRATCRHPGPPRGTALFDADPDLAGHLADGLRQHGCEPRLVRTASLAAAGSTDGAACAVAGQPRRAEHLVLVQDETVAAFAAVAAVALQAVQRARQQGTPVSLVSVPGRAAYSDLGPAADGLHGSQAALGQTRALLTAEQVVTLVEAAGADCEPPEARPAGPQVAPEAGLDPDQERAVEAGCGPTRVLAPAGSGKTRVLTSRVLALLRRGVPPSAILALAFNRRAAEEMAARLQRQGVPVAGRLGQCGVSVRTFHSLGNELVQQHLGWRYDEGAGAVAARIAAEVFARHSGLEPGTYRRAEAQDFVRQHVSRAKTCLLTTAGASLAFDGRQVPYAPLFAAFLEQQRQARHYEYDDMVYLALLLLLRSAGGRHQVQRRFAHVLVDEFQDLNPAQLLLADVLALPQGNLYVVGDDDQVIYGWRGARVEHLLSFEDIQFNGDPQETVTTAAPFAIASDCRCDGFLLWLNLFVDADSMIDTFSHSVWGAIYMAGEPLSLRAGDSLDVRSTVRPSGNGIHPDYTIECTARRGAERMHDYVIESRH